MAVDISFVFKKDSNFHECLEANSPGPTEEAVLTGPFDHLR